MVADSVSKRWLGRVAASWGRFEADDHGCRRRILGNPTASQPGVEVTSHHMVEAETQETGCGSSIATSWREQSKRRVFFFSIFFGGIGIFAFWTKKMVRRRLKSDGTVFVKIVEPVEISFLVPSPWWAAEEEVGSGEARGRAGGERDAERRAWRCRKG